MMTFSEFPLWFFHWFILLIGSWFVIVGLIMEDIPDWKRFDWPKDSPKRHRVVRGAIYVIVIGVSIEAIQTVVLDTEASKTRKMAGDAAVHAALIESNNLVLRSNVASLEIAVRELTHLYDQSTNALAEANERLRSIRPIKERLTEWLDQVDPSIIPALRDGKTTFRLELQIYEVGALTSFERESGASAYIASANIGTTLILGGRLGGQSREVTIELKPELVK